MTASPSDPRNGQAVDWSAALAEHGRWLRVAILARVGERLAVEEVMQEVALAAVAQKAPLADPAKRGAWLHRLAVRQALLHRRARGRRGRRETVYAGRNATETGREADPLDWLLRDERAALVRLALARLPRRDAEILMLKYAEDWSYRDLADHLGLSPSAVEARLHRARQKMRSLLSGSSVIEVRE